VDGYTNTDVISSATDCPHFQLAQFHDFIPKLQQSNIVSELIQGRTRIKRVQNKILQPKMEEITGQK
jgi:hypothetical protein